MLVLPRPPERLGVEPPGEQQPQRRRYPQRVGGVRHGEPEHVLQRRLGEGRPVQQQPVELVRRGRAQPYAQPVGEGLPVSRRGAAGQTQLGGGGTGGGEQRRVRRGAIGGLAGGTGRGAAVGGGDAGPQQLDRHPELVDRAAAEVRLRGLGLAEPVDPLAQDAD